MFRLKGSPKAEQETKRAVYARLRERRRRSPRYQEEWEKRAYERSQTMAFAEFSRFWLLRRQFEGSGNPGFATIMRAARFLVRQLRKIRPG
jgi:hypothetical protein